MSHLAPGPGRAPAAGGEIAYQVAGAGPPVAGSHPYWMPRSGYPPLRGFTTITVWPRGFGASSAARGQHDYGFWRLADDLDAVRRHLGLEQWTYWGVSFGGMTGQVYALRYPGSLTALILDGTAASYHYREDPASIWPTVRQRPESAAYRQNPTPETQRAFFGLIGELLGRWGLPPEPADKEYNPHALAECLQRLDDYDVREQLRELRMPTLVLVGEQDRSCPPSQARIIAAAIPSATLQVFPGVGHGVRFHDPPGLTDLIHDFVGAALARP